MKYSFQGYSKVMVLIVTLVLFATVGICRGANRKPNIVLIMADDLGYETITANGGTSYKTPNLDKLAATGARFTHCFASPICSPSRVQIMTGLYPFRTGWIKHINQIPRNKQRLSPSFTTFAHMLKKAGYATAVAGKWQLARFDDNPEHATQLGFDDYCLWTWSFGEKENPSRYWKPNIWQNGKLITEVQRDNIYGPDIFTEFILNFIRNHKESPFFAYYPMVLPHAPFQYTPDNLNRKEVSDQQKMFADMVSYMDKLVGQIISTIKELGLKDKTIILFTADNGTPRRIVSSMGDISLRGGKGKVTDLGTRVPLIAGWKGVIPSGLVCHDLIDFTDFFPTLAHIAEIEKQSSFRIDGHSFLPQLKGEKGNPRKWVFLQLNRRQAFRTKHWKLNQYGWLFNLKEDPFELHPILKGKDNVESSTARKDIEEIVRKMFHIKGKNQ